MPSWRKYMIPSSAFCLLGVLVMIVPVRSIVLPMMLWFLFRAIFFNFRVSDMYRTLGPSSDRGANGRVSVTMPSALVAGCAAMDLHQLTYTPALRCGLASSFTSSFPTGSKALMAMLAS